jgi:opacity protein-like surface antigen
MRNFARRLASAAVVFAPVATAVALATPMSTLAAQSSGPYVTGSIAQFHVSPYVGYMVFGNMFSGPVGTSVSNKPGALYGAQIGMSIMPNLSLLGNIGTSSSSMQVGLPIIGGVSVGSSSMVLYDADLEYDFANPSSHSVLTPFVQAGIGAMHYNIDAADFITTDATNVAYNVGIGADFAVSKGVALRFLAKDYIGKFDIHDATGLGIDGSTSHNFGLTAGLRFDF